MSRGTIEGLPSSYPLVDALPAIYQEDPFTRDFMDAFDVLLAPIVSTLDNLPAYLDPALAPDDFLEWLASWVAAMVDETWPIDQRRRFVAQAASLHRHRGTVDGLRNHLRIFTDGEIVVEETGSASWSPTAGTPLPPPSPPRLHVRVLTRPGTTLDPAKLDALVAAAKPAHLSHSIDIQTGRAGSAPNVPPGDPASGSR